MAHVDVQDVSKTFGSFQAISDLDLSVDKGQFCALLGPSGCGKSTLLRMIAGLEAVTEGKIFINGEDVTDVAPAKRRIAMVFQSYALYPHMTVRQNIGFSLDVGGMAKPEIKSRVDEVARILQMEDLLDRKPSQLSGGQRQRVAIGRALVRSPEVFLFDEPLSNLDAKLRVQMRFELAKLHRELGATMIYVTHDQVEAMTLASKIVVLDSGRVSQVGTPLELYHKPANKFVASFIGSPQMNFLTVALTGAEGQKATLSLGSAGSLAVETRAPFDAKTDGQFEIGVRPEHIKLVEPGADGAQLDGSIDIVEHLGNTTIVYVTTPAGPLVVQAGEEEMHGSGDTVGLRLDPTRVHLFGSDQQAL